MEAPLPPLTNIFRLFRLPPVSISSPRVTRRLDKFRSHARSLAPSFCCLTTRSVGTHASKANKRPLVSWKVVSRLESVARFCEDGTYSSRESCIVFLLT